MAHVSERFSHRHGSESPQNTALMRVSRVNFNTPLESIPISCIKKSGDTPQHLVDVAHERGLKAAVLTRQRGRKHDDLVVWHGNGMDRLLEERRDELKSQGWPTQTSEFILRLSNNPPLPETPVYDVVADAKGKFMDINRETFPPNLSMKRMVGVTLLRLVVSSRNTIKSSVSDWKERKG